MIKKVRVMASVKDAPTKAPSSLVLSAPRMKERYAMIKPREHGDANVIAPYMNRLKASIRFILFT